MARIFLLSLMFSFILGINAALAEPIIEKELAERPNVSILPFKNKSTIVPEFAQKIALRDASIVSDFLLERLWHTGRFRTIDREELEEIIKELEFSQSGLVSSVSATTAGKQLGVKYIIRGSVTDISVKPTTAADISVANKGGFSANKVTVSASISVKFVNVETGEAVLIASGTGKSSRGDAELSINEKYYEISGTISDGSGEHFEATAKIKKDIGYSVKVGSSEVSQIQVRNALYKAVIDAVEDKDYGLLALIDGSTKKRKV